MLCYCVAIALSSGCRDGSIHHHDVRKPDHIVAMSKAHHHEVCGMQWSPDGSRLASGGNDNLVCVWNASNPTEPFKVLRGHQAAVKVTYMHRFGIYKTIFLDLLLRY